MGKNFDNLFLVLGATKGDKPIISCYISKALVSEKGMDAAAVSGSGRDGRITKEDAMKAQPAPAAAAPKAEAPKAEAPKGFNKEYLQAVVDGKHPRPMVSVEKAKELLNNMQEGVAEGLEQLNRIRKLSGLDEALKLDAPQQAWSKQDMQDYATRIKTGTKTKQDRFKMVWSKRDIPEWFNVSAA